MRVDEAWVGGEEEEADASSVSLLHYPWAAEQLQRLPYTLLHLRTALHSRNHFFISSSSHHYLSHHQAFMEGNLAGCPWVFSLSEFQYVGLCVVWCIVFHNIPSLALDPTLYYTDRNQMFILPMSSKKKFSSCRKQNFQYLILFLASHLQDLPRHLSRRMEIWFDLQNVSEDLQNISSLTPGSDVNAKQKCTICLGKSLQPKPRSTMPHFEYFAYFALTVFVTVGVED